MWKCYLTMNQPPRKPTTTPCAEKHRLITIFLLFFATGFYSWAAEFNVGSRLLCPWWMLLFGICWQIVWFACVIFSSSLLYYTLKLRFTLHYSFMVILGVSFWWDKIWMRFITTIHGVERYIWRHLRFLSNRISSIPRVFPWKDSCLLKYSKKCFSSFVQFVAHAFLYFPWVNNLLDV